MSYSSVHEVALHLAAQIVSQAESCAFTVKLQCISALPIGGRGARSGRYLHPTHFIIVEVFHTVSAKIFEVAFLV
jgi:hypothetical protein